MTPCPHCKQTFRHGEVNACCSGCGEAFAGQEAFDSHQRVSDDGQWCMPPREVIRKDGRARLYRKSVSGGEVWAQIQY